MNINQKGFANIALITVVVAIVAVGGYFVFVKKLEPIAQQPTPNQTADLKTYTNTQYGFEFQYPASWKRVADANSSDGTTVTVIYPVSYPAQDFSARVAVYQSNLATTQKDNPLFQNKSFSTVTVNNISWTKIQMTGNTGIPLDSFQYLTEKNGKTYDVGGSADLTNQILSAFKFTN